MTRVPGGAQPHLCRTVESGPSGRLQLAPLTGNHQGAAATSKQQNNGVSDTALETLTPHGQRKSQASTPT